MATDQLKITHIVSDTVKWYSMVRDASYFVIDSRMSRWSQMEKILVNNRATDREANAVINPIANNVRREFLIP